jgi:hypothetical protein
MHCPEHLWGPTTAATMDEIATKLNAGERVILPYDVIVCFPGSPVVGKIPSSYECFYEWHDAMWYVFVRPR